MRYVSNNVTKYHVRVFAGMLALFSTLTFLAMDAGLSPGPEHDLRVLQASVFTITGPLTGAISRGFQSCCLNCSLSLMACCAPVLVSGVLLQFIRLPDRRLTRAMQMAFWILGWLVWFLGGIVSFGHALS